MLKSLFIKNFALVETLELNFDCGFTVLTGETGAGKSLLIGAISTILGGKIEPSLIARKGDETIIEATFSNVKIDHPEFKNDNILVIRRNFDKKGKSIAFINGNPVSLPLLRNIAKEMVEINGQHQSARLLDEDNHQKLLDDLPSLKNLSNEVSQLAKEIKEDTRILKLLEGKQEELKRRIENLEYDIREIEKVNPKEDEEKELKEKKRTLENSVKITENLSKIASIIALNDNCVINQLKEVLKRCEELSLFESEWKNYFNDIEASRNVIGEIGTIAERELESLNFSPDELDKISERLYEIEKLERKYGPTLGDVLNYYHKCKKECLELKNRTFDKDTLRKNIQKKFDEFLKKAKILSEERRKEAENLSKKVVKILKELAIEKGKFEVEFNPFDIRDFEDVTEKGLEECKFLFSAQESEPVMPLSKIASGGELSRIMLSILSSISDTTKEKTLIFDEIDTGIGGRPAEKVGLYLHSLSLKNQVLAVTHLPQIAVYAKNHIKVEKIVKKDKTTVFAKVLKEEEIPNEIGRMVSGEKITENAFLYAEELLKIAKEKKKIKG